MATDFWQRLKQRKIAQWGLAYLAGAWLLLQLLALLAQPFAWPDLVLRAVTVVLGIGFFGALVIAWYHGERGAQRVSGIELLMLTGILVVAAGAVTLVTRGRSPASAAAVKPDASQAKVNPKSLAVLPFENVSAQPNSDYFSDGLTEELISALNNVPGLAVASRTATARYKGAQVDPAEVGRALGVAHILSGSVRMAGSKVRIVAELSPAGSGPTVWSNTYDGELEDIITLQEQIARAIAQALQLELGAAADMPLARVGTGNLKAYTLFLQARFHNNRFSELTLRRALALYEDALKEDPRFARAYAGIANVWASLADDWIAPAEAYPKAREAALKSIEIDPTVGDSHAQLSTIQQLFDWDLAKAESTARRAVALDAEDERVHRTLGRGLALREKFDEAEAEGRRAIAIDPWAPGARQQLARQLLQQHRFDEALRETREYLRVAPNDMYAYRLLGDIYLATGQPQSALTAYEKGLSFDSAYVRLLAGRARALVALGRTAEAQQIAARLEEERKRRYVRAEEIASIYVALGNHDRAFQLLEQAVKDRSAGMPYIRTWPMWDPLRADPRFKALQKKVGLG